MTIVNNIFAAIKGHYNLRLKEIQSNSFKPFYLRDSITIYVDLWQGSNSKSVFNEIFVSSNLIGWPKVINGQSGGGKSSMQNIW